MFSTVLKNYNNEKLRNDSLMQIRLKRQILHDVVNSSIDILININITSNTTTLHRIFCSVPYYNFLDKFL